MASWQNCKLAKWQVGKIASWQNGKLMKCQVNKMASWSIANWWNGKLEKWQVDKMASWQNGKLMKCQVNKMASWLNSKLIKWHIGKMASWQNVNLMKWLSAKFFVLVLLHLFACSEWNFEREKRKTSFPPFSWPPRFLKIRLGLYSKNVSLITLVWAMSKLWCHNYICW